jgi:acetate kinase
LEVAAGKLMRVLTVNAGSTSLKLERYELPAALPPIAEPIPPAYSAEPALASAEDALAGAAAGGVDAVAHRFVQMPAGTPDLVRLDGEWLERIASAGADDPLHDSAALRAVAIIGRMLPGVPQFAVSDSRFHRTMPEAATTYALPREVVGGALHRIGYHGLSHEYAAHRGCAIAGIDITHSRVVTAHLGGGSSLCAVLNGESIDTTMGFTPLEGLPMATRSGSVDPGLLLHLLRNGITPDELEAMLEHRSGLLGISGLSGDVRDLLAAGGNAAAKRALDVLVWRIRAALGAMIAVLGGIDLIVFTGGIGEHASSIRADVVQNGLGVNAKIDAILNANVSEGRIAAEQGPAIVVVRAREGWQLARSVQKAT